MVRKVQIPVTYLSGIVLVPAPLGEKDFKIRIQLPIQKKRGIGPDDES